MIEEQYVSLDTARMRIKPISAMIVIVVSVFKSLEIK